MQTNQKIVIKFLITTLITAIVCGIVTYSSFGLKSLINFEIAYFLSMIVVIATFLAYSKKVKNEKSDYVIDENEDDELDKIDDKHELFKKIKESNSQNTFNLKRMLLGSKLFFSIYRILAYLFLIVAILVLIKKGYFEVISFLIGTTMFIVSTLIFYTLEKKE